MRLRRNDNHCLTAEPLDVGCDNPNFVSRIVDCGVYYADCIRWHAFVHQNTRAEEVLA
jgi:hypothetical protein